MSWRPLPAFAEFAAELSGGPIVAYLLVAGRPVGGRAADGESRAKKR